MVADRRHLSAVLCDSHTLCSAVSTTARRACRLCLRAAAIDVRAGATAGTRMVSASVLSQIAGESSSEGRAVQAIMRLPWSRRISLP
jgi:hypothetical protein